MDSTLNDKQIVFPKEYLGIELAFTKRPVPGRLAKRSFLLTRGQKVQVDPNGELQSLHKPIKAQMPDEEPADVASGGQPRQGKC